MHIPIPVAALARSLRRAYTYFRTGVAVEGEAWLCEQDHIPIIWSGQIRQSVLQHVDVDLRFWNRRHQRVTILELAGARIPMYRVELEAASYPTFNPLTLEPGANRQESFFVLVPRGAPDTRVEAAVGSWLELEFLPSGGSERWARPRIRLQLGVRDPG
jgi:hypothetical protein